MIPEIDRTAFLAAERVARVEDRHVLPIIDAGDGDLAKVANEAWSALLGANDPPMLFRHGGVPAWIEHDDRGEPITRHLSADRLRYQLARVIRWQRTSNNRTSSANPPGAVVGDILATPDPPLPVLERIVECPVFSRDGSVSLDPGYHAEAKVFFAPGPGLTIPPVPHHPTPQDVARARGLLLDDLLGDFPFVDDAARAHTLSLILQPACRGLIDGPTPLYVVEKPSPGTGATLLVDQIGVLATGRPPSALTEGSSEDEWRKRITAKLMRSPSLIVIDNLRDRLDSAALSAALTADTFEDRVLGLTQMVTLPVRCTWVATGNNPVMSNEIARRSVSIRLDAKVDRPWERDTTAFRHPSLREWVMGERGQLVWATLTLTRAWLAAGRPAPTGRPLGSFESWSRVMGGILEVADVRGFLANMDEFYASADAESEEWRAFTATWWERYGDTRMTTAELYETASEYIDLGHKGDRSRKTILGQLLVAKRDRRFGQFKLTRGEDRSGAATWKLAQG